MSTETKEEENDFVADPTVSFIDELPNLTQPSLKRYITFRHASNIRVTDFKNFLLYAPVKKSPSNEDVSLKRFAKRLQLLQENAFASSKSLSSTNIHLTKPAVSRGVVIVHGSNASDRSFVTRLCLERLCKGNMIARVRSVEKLSSLFTSSLPLHLNNSNNNISNISAQYLQLNSPFNPQTSILQCSRSIRIYYHKNTLDIQSCEMKLVNINVDSLISLQGDPPGISPALLAALSHPEMRGREKLMQSFQPSATLLARGEEALRLLRSELTETIKDLFPQVLRILGALLHLISIDIYMTKDNNNDKNTFLNTAVSTAAELLGVKPAELDRALHGRMVTQQMMVTVPVKQAKSGSTKKAPPVQTQFVNKEVLVRLSDSEATILRHAFIKVLYLKIVQQLFNLCNERVLSVNNIANNSTWEMQVMELDTTSLDPSNASVTQNLLSQKLILQTQQLTSSSVENSKAYSIEQIRYLKQIAQQLERSHHQCETSVNDHFRTMQELCTSTTLEDENTVNIFKTKEDLWQVLTRSSLPLIALSFLPVPPSISIPLTVTATNGASNTTINISLSSSIALQVNDIQYIQEQLHLPLVQPLCLEIFCISYDKTDVMKISPRFAEEEKHNNFLRRILLSRGPVCNRPARSYFCRKYQALLLTQSSDRQILQLDRADLLAVIQKLCAAHGWDTNAHFHCLIRSLSIKSFTEKITFEDLWTNKYDLEQLSEEEERWKRDTVTVTDTILHMLDKALSSLLNTSAVQIQRIWRGIYPKKKLHAAKQLYRMICRLHDDRELRHWQELEMFWQKRLRLVLRVQRHFRYVRRQRAAVLIQQLFRRSRRKLIASAFMLRRLVTAAQLGNFFLATQHRRKMKTQLLQHQNQRVSTETSISWVLSKQMPSQRLRQLQSALDAATTMYLADKFIFNSSAPALINTNNDKPFKAPLQDIKIAKRTNLTINAHDLHVAKKKVIGGVTGKRNDHRSTDYGSSTEDGSSGEENGDFVSVGSDDGHSQTHSYSNSLASSGSHSSKTTLPSLIHQLKSVCNPLFHLQDERALKLWRKLSGTQWLSDETQQVATWLQENTLPSPALALQLQTLHQDLQYYNDSMLQSNANTESRDRRDDDTREANRSIRKKRGSGLWKAIVSVFSSQHISNQRNANDYYEDAHHSSKDRGVIEPGFITVRHPIFKDLRLLQERLSQLAKNAKLVSQQLDRGAIVTTVPPAELCQSVLHQIRKLCFRISRHVDRFIDAVVAIYGDGSTYASKHRCHINQGNNDQRPLDVTCGSDTGSRGVYIYNLIRVLDTMQSEARRGRDTTNVNSRQSNNDSNDVIQWRNRSEQRLQQLFWRYQQIEAGETDDGSSDMDAPDHNNYTNHGNILQRVSDTVVNVSLALPSQNGLSMVCFQHWSDMYKYLLRRHPFYTPRRLLGSDFVNFIEEQTTLLNRYVTFESSLNNVQLVQGNDTVDYNSESTFQWLHQQRLQCIALGRLAHVLLHLPPISQKLGNKKRDLEDGLLCHALPLHALDAGSSLGIEIAVNAMFHLLQPSSPIDMWPTSMLIPPSKGQNQEQQTGFDPEIPMLLQVQLSPRDTVLCRDNLSPEDIFDRVMKGDSQRRNFFNRMVGVNGDGDNPFMTLADIFYDPLRLEMLSQESLSAALIACTMLNLHSLAPWQVLLSRDGKHIVGFSIDTSDSALLASQKLTFLRFSAAQVNNATNIVNGASTGPYSNNSNALSVYQHVNCLLCLPAVEFCCLNSQQINMLLGNKESSLLLLSSWFSETHRLEKIALRSLQSTHRNTNLSLLQLHKDTLQTIHQRFEILRSHLLQPMAQQSLRHQSRLLETVLKAINAPLINFYSEQRRRFPLGPGSIGLDDVVSASLIYHITCSHVHNQASPSDNKGGVNAKQYMNLRVKEMLRRGFVPVATTSSISTILTSAQLQLQQANLSPNSPSQSLMDRKPSPLQPIEVDNHLWSPVASPSQDRPPTTQLLIEDTALCAVAPPVSLPQQPQNSIPLSPFRQQMLRTQHRLQAKKNTFSEPIANLPPVLPNPMEENSNYEYHGHITQDKFTAESPLKQRHLFFGKEDKRDYAEENSLQRRDSISRLKREEFMTQSAPLAHRPRIIPFDDNRKRVSINNHHQNKVPISGELLGDSYDTTNNKEKKLTPLQKLLCERRPRFSLPPTCIDPLRYLFYNKNNNISSHSDKKSNCYNHSSRQTSIEQSMESLSLLSAMEYFLSCIDFRTMPLSNTYKFTSNSSDVDAENYVMAHLGSCFFGSNKLCIRNATHAQLTAFFSLYPHSTSHTATQLYLCFDEIDEEQRWFVSVSPDAEEDMFNMDSHDDDPIHESEHQSLSKFHWDQLQHSGVSRNIIVLVKHLLYRATFPSTFRYYHLVTQGIHNHGDINASSRKREDVKYLRSSPFHYHKNVKHNDNFDFEENSGDYNDNNPFHIEREWVKNELSGDENQLLQVTLPVIFDRNIHKKKKESYESEESEEKRLLEVVRSATNLFLASTPLEMSLSRARIALLAHFVHCVSNNRSSSATAFDNSCLLLSTTKLLLRYDALTPLFQDAHRLQMYALPFSDHNFTYSTSSRYTTAHLLRLQCVLVHYWAEKDSLLFVSRYESLLHNLVAQHGTCVLSVLCAPICVTQQDTASQRLCERLFRHGHWRCLTNTLSTLRSALFTEIAYLVNVDDDNTIRHREDSNYSCNIDKRIESFIGYDILHVNESIQIQDEYQSMSLQVMRPLVRLEEKFFFACMFVCGNPWQVSTTSTLSVRKTQYLDISVSLWGAVSGGTNFSNQNNHSYIVSRDTEEITRELLFALYVPQVQPRQTCDTPSPVPLLRAIVCEEYLLCRVVSHIQRYLIEENDVPDEVCDTCVACSAAAHKYCLMQCPSHHSVSRDTAGAISWQEVLRRVCYVVMCRMRLLRHVTQLLLQLLLTASNLSEEDRHVYIWEFSLNIYLDDIKNNIVEINDISNDDNNVKKNSIDRTVNRRHTVQEDHIVMQLAVTPLQQWLSRYNNNCNINNNINNNNNGDNSKDTVHSVSRLICSLVEVCHETEDTPPLMWLRTQSVLLRDTVCPAVPPPVSFLPQLMCPDVSHPRHTANYNDILKHMSL